jgi:hypothetical protein
MAMAGIPALKLRAMRLADEFPVIEKLWFWMYEQHRKNINSGNPKWPKEVFFPSLAITQYLMDSMGKRSNQWYQLLTRVSGLQGLSPGSDRKRVSRTLGDAVVHLQSLGQWIVTQGIYIFHPLVFQEVWQPYKGVITTNFLRLPEWSVYIKLNDYLTTSNDIPVEWKNIDGALVWYDWHLTDNMRKEMQNTGADESMIEGTRVLNIRLIGVQELEKNDFPNLHLFRIVLTPKGTVEDAVADYKDIYRFDLLFRCIMSLLSYLGDRTCDRASSPTKPVAKRLLSGKGAKFPEIDQPRIYKVGFRLGPVLGELREMLQTTIINTRTGAGSRAAVVRAHPSKRLHGHRDSVQWWEDCWIYPYLRGFEIEEWRDYPSVVRRVMLVSPTLRRKYPAIAEELGLKFVTPEEEERTKVRELDNYYKSQISGEEENGKAFEDRSPHPDYASGL